MVYLFGDPLVGLVPHLAQVDGSRDAPLLRPEARAQCPYSGRPSESPDGGSMALMCKYDSRNVAGLFVVGIDGTGLTHLDQAYSLKENLTWEGGDHIVYVSAPSGDGQPTILMRVAAAGGTPEPLTDGSTGWDWHPDWSDAGLLFLAQARRQARRRLRPRCRQPGDPADVGRQRGVAHVVTRQPPLRLPRARQRR